MADYLQDLSYGLRQAATILSPEIQQQVFRADEREKNLADSAVLQHVLQQSTPQAQMAREQLKNEQQFRKAVAAAGGDFGKIAEASMMFGKPEVAQNIFNAHEQRLSRVETARMANQRQLQELEMRLSDQAITREQRDRLAQIADETRRQGQALQAQIAQGNQELRRLQIQLSGNEQLRRQEDLIDKGVTQFSNDLQQNKIPSLYSSISAANTLLSKYQNKDDIPGVGFVEGSPKLTNSMRSEEGKNVRSAVQAVTNDLLNLYSGLAVTLPESERRELEQMRGGDFSEADFKNAWPRIVDRYNAVVGNLAAGHKPEVINRYKERPGAMSLSPVIPAFRTGGWRIEEKK